MADVNETNVNGADFNELDGFANGENSVDGMDAPATGKRAKGSKKEKKVKEKKPPRDNIAIIAGITSISGARKAIQIANAKKAKAAGKPETQAKYEAEIEAAKAKLQELLDTAAASENKLQALIDMDEEPNKVITAVIADKEAEVAAYSEEKDVKFTKAALKNVTNEIPQSLFGILPLDLHEAVIARHEKKDYRLQAICQKINFMEAVENGDLVKKGAKWYDKDAVPADEPAADEAENTESTDAE